MLESRIRAQRKNKEILLMSHIVIGYPDLDTSMALVAEMVEAGVDIMELQIPFSEPFADGPVILAANQKALETGISVAQCFAFAREAAQRFDIPFLFMTYGNIPFKYGVQKFAADTAECGLQGAIVVDFTPEESAEYLYAMRRNRLSAINIFAPTSTAERMQTVAARSSGFIYCVARTGVTGKDTRFSHELGDYLQRCRQATTLPLAVGFGVKTRDDVDFLKGKADIAVVGSQTIRVMEEKGVKAAGAFIRELIG